MLFIAKCSRCNRTAKIQQIHCIFEINIWKYGSILSVYCIRIVYVTNLYKILLYSSKSCNLKNAQIVTTLCHKFLDYVDFLFSFHRKYLNELMLPGSTIRSKVLHEKYVINRNMIKYFFDICLNASDLSLIQFLLIYLEVVSLALSYSM